MPLNYDSHRSLPAVVVTAPWTQLLELEQLPPSPSSSPYVPSRQWQQKNFGNRTLTDLRSFVGKIEFLRFLLQQIEEFGGHLASDNLDYLLPAVHRNLIMAALESRAVQLERLRNLQLDHHAFRSRMRWGLLDKSDRKDSQGRH